LTANHEKVYEVVLLALKTGMRKGEITALTVDHVDFDENIITVQAAWSDKGKKYRNQTKNGGYRRIDMNADVFEVLWKYRDASRTERIFAKIMRSHTIKHFSKLTQLANVRELHFHALRHTFLTNIANGIGMDAPVDIVKVMELAVYHSCRCY
jgi:integrase